MSKLNSEELQTHKPDKKLRTKDLIYAGAFGAIYLVLMLIIVMGSSMIPVLYLLTPLTVGVVCGTVYMLCVVKVHKFGAALILGILFAVITTMSVLPGFILAICAALAAEVILWLGKYRSRVMYLLSFVFFNINMTGPFLRFLYDKEAFIADTVSYYGEEHAQALSAITPEWVFWGILAGAIVGGIIGSFIANRLIKKHFEKAGVV